MKNIMSKFLLVGNKFMTEMHLRHPAACDKSKFMYNECGPFPKKNKKRTQKFQETLRF